jgi:hypothetical protein
MFEQLMVGVLHIQAKKTGEQSNNLERFRKMDKF